MNFDSIMARPSNPTRRSEIIAAARALTASDGITAAQMTAVADRAGIAVGTVYRYFRSRDELIAAVTADVSTQYLQAMRAAAAAAPGPLSALAASMAVFARSAAQERTLIAAIFGNCDSDSNQASLRCRRELTEFFAERIAVAGDQLPKMDTRLAASGLVGLLAEILLSPLNVREKRADPSEAALLALRSLGIADSRARGLIGTQMAR